MNGPVDARLVKLPQYVDANSDGLLVVTEAREHVPFHQIEIDARQNETVLIVLCDRPYEEHDYIRNYAEFLSFRKAPRA